MGYQSPRLEDLRKIVDELEQEYKGDNQQRHSFILLLKKLTEKTSTSFPDSARNTLLGAMIFELEIIHSEYKIAWLKRSTMDAKLFEKMKIDAKNQIGDDDRFVYLYALYQYVVMLCSNSMITELGTTNPGFVWKSKDSLLAAVKDRLKSIRKRDHQFHQLTHAKPRVGALQKSTAELCAKVMSANGNVERARLAKFVEYIHYASDYLYKDEYKKIPKMYDIEQDTRRGLLLYALMHIYNEYRVLSPEGGCFNSGSQLFRDGLEALNIKKLDDISPFEKTELLRSLKERIVEIEREKNNPEMLKYLQDKGVDSPISKDEFIKEIAIYHNDQDRLKHEPKGVTAAFSSFAGYATQTTAQSAIQRGVAPYAVKGALGMAAMTFGGPVGLLGYGALTCVGSMVGDNLISSMTANIYSWLIEKLGSTIGAAAAGMFAGQYSVSSEGIAELRKQLEPEDEKQFCAWVNALLSVPLDVVSESEKDSIRRVFGLEKGKQLLPLEQPAHRIANARVLG